MQVLIQHQPRELLIHTVSLAKNDLEPDNVFLFRCPYCSSTLGAQIQGVVVKISPGFEPTENVPVIHFCKECKRLYTFQTLEFMDKRFSRITLATTPNTVGIFHCWLCRNPLLQFIGDKVVKLPSFELIHLPITMGCVKPDCPIKYRILDTVSMP